MLFCNVDVAKRSAEQENQTVLRRENAPLKIYFAKIICQEILPMPALANRALKYKKRQNRRRVDINNYFCII